MDTTSQDAVRAGVFPDLKSADNAVERLIAAGFTTDQITVICSDDSKERHFREFEHQAEAGSNAGDGSMVGATIGAIAGGLAAIAVGVASGGTVPLIIAGAAGLSGGSAMGGFAGAMVTRFEEKEVSNFYDQAVRRGQILVAVEVHGEGAPAKLVRAARVIAEAGAEVVRLPEG